MTESNLGFQQWKEWNIGNRNLNVRKTEVLERQIKFSKAAGTSSLLRDGDFDDF